MVNAPMAAKVPWHSEIVPPMPVVTMTESRMTAERDAARGEAQPVVVEHEER